MSVFARVTLRSRARIGEARVAERGGEKRQENKKTDEHSGAAHAPISPLDGPTFMRAARAARAAAGTG